MLRVRSCKCFEIRFYIKKEHIPRFFFLFFNIVLKYHVGSKSFGQEWEGVYLFENDEDVMDLRYILRCNQQDLMSLHQQRKDEGDSQSFT